MEHKFYKLIRIDENIHDDLKYWFNTGRPIILQINRPIDECDLYGADKSWGPRFVELTNVDVILAVKKHNAIVISDEHRPTTWLPSKEWHDLPPLYLPVNKE